MKEENINTHNMTLGFGKFKDELYTRVPVSYLQWMVNIGHSKAKYADAELKRRGTVMPSMDISGHAIDRFSLNCLDIYRRYRNKGEGMHAFMQRIIADAMKLNKRDKHKRYCYLGMMIAVNEEGAWPVVQTVIREKPSHNGEANSEQL